MKLHLTVELFFRLKRRPERLEVDLFRSHPRCHETRLKATEKRLRPTQVELALFHLHERLEQVQTDSPDTIEAVIRLRSAVSKMHSSSLPNQFFDFFTQDMLGSASRPVNEERFSVGLMLRQPLPHR
jgi:hypothetical protein